MAVALSLGLSFLNALVVSDPYSSLSASLAYSSCTCAVIASQIQFTLCLFIQETFMEHLLYFRRDSGYHVWEQCGRQNCLGTMWKTRQARSLPSAGLSLFSVLVSGSFPQCLLLWISQVEDLIGPADLAGARLNMSRCWSDSLTTILRESIHL